MLLWYGGVGGYFVARLANAGYDVSFIARGEHLKAIKNNGLKIISELGDMIIYPAKASDNPADFEIADIVLFCVKSYDTESSSKIADTVASQMTGNVGEKQKILGKNSVIGGVAAISALISEPGVIQHNSAMQMLKFGEFNNIISPRIKAFQEACEKSGINNNIPENIECDIWQKIIMICTLAGANCITRLPLGVCRTNPATRNFMKNLAEEAVEIAKAENIILPDNQVEITMKQLDSLPEGYEGLNFTCTRKRRKIGSLCIEWCNFYSRQ